MLIPWSRKYRHGGRRKTQLPAKLRPRVESLEPRVLLIGDSVVVFNEIMYNPAGNEESLEWVELFNQHAVNIDMSGWRLTGAAEFEFAEGTVIPGRGHMVIASDPAALQAATGFGDASGPFRGQLNNAGDEIRLLDNNDRIMNTIGFNDRGDWPVGPDGSGASLAKRDPQSNSELAENWATNLFIGGSPGAINFPSVDEIPPTPVNLIFAGDDVRVLVPTQASELPSDWNQPTFDDAADPNFFDSQMGVGYDTGGPSDVSALIDPGGDIQSEMFGVNTSAFLRSEFTVDPASINQLSLDLDFNDGFVAYLNGTEVARRNAPEGDLDWNATSRVESAISINFAADIDGSAAVGEQLAGVAPFSNWNDIPLAQQTNQSLVDSLGNVVPNLTLSTPQTFSVPTSAKIASGVNFEEPGDTAMMRGGVLRIFADLNISFAGVIPYDIFDIYVYYNTGLSTDASISILDGGGGSLGLSRAAAEGAGGDTEYVLANVDGTNNANYVLFAGLTSADVPEDFIIHVTEGTVRSMNGVQIVNRGESAAVAGLGHAEIDLTGYVGSLQPSDNVLAIQGLNAAADNTDFLLNAELNALLVTPPPSELKPVINEVAAATEQDFWLEIANPTSQSIELDGLELVASESGSSYIFPVQTLAAGGYLAVTEAELGFDVVDGERLFLYGPAQNEFIDARRVTNRLRGRSTQHDGDWLYPNAATPGGANSFTFHEDIVINEIMYHFRPQLATADTPFAERDEEWIEFHNRGATAVDLTGWTIRDAVDFDFPAGTMIGPGAYLVVARDAQALAAKYPTINIVGQYAGVLNNEDDNILLRDAFDNPADEVHYYDRGRWGEFADGGGSSLELRDPQSDNTHAEAWAISEEGSKSQWQTHTNQRTAQPFQGQFRSPIGGAVPPVQFNDFLFGFLDSGEVLLDDIHVRTQDSFEVETLLAIDATTMWRYNDSGADLGPAWYETTYSTNDPGWSEGPTLIGFETAPEALPRPIRTELADPQTNDPFVLTHYFQTEFDFNGDVNDFDTLELFPVLDDGAVFYLNGVEVFRLRMPAGEITAQTSAMAFVNEADFEGPFDIPKTLLRQGSNTLSVELHQWDASSSDFIFGTEVQTSTTMAGVGSDLIQNGDFEDDALGQVPALWRIGGNYQGEVIQDPDDPNNKVLRLRGFGAMGYVSNSAETTFLNNRPIVVGNDYEVSFRAKWIGGSRQLNNRAWYSHIAETTQLQAHELHGTPGTQNSQFQFNIGPTFTDLEHSPVVPQVAEAVRVSVAALDPNGVASAELFWSTGGPFNSVPMTVGIGGKFTALIPGQVAGTITQFYVEATDGLGATSMFPSAGPESGAVYEVDDGAADVAATRGVDSLRLVLTNENTNFLHSNTNLMSDGFLRGTLIVNESEAHHDIGIRLRGSQHSRDAASRVGFVVELEPDDLYRGVHGRFSIDRSTRSDNTPTGPAEIIVRQFMNHAGDIASEYGDIIQVVAPRSIHNSPAHLRLAQFGEVYLDTQYENGDDSPLFELEMLFTPPGFVGGDPNNAKIHTAGPFYDYDLEDIGDDKEQYRFHLNIKNGREKDDYSRIIAANKALSIPAGPEFDAAIADTIDVDNWMRAMATKSLTMDFDGYGSVNYRHNQNIMFYVRPTDNKVIAMPWDIDGSFVTGFVPVNSAIYPTQGITNLTKLIERPVNFRLFLGHLQDMIQTTFNRAYMLPWMEHFGEKAGQNLTTNINLIESRGNVVLSRLPAEIPFAITTPGPLNVGANSTATIAGDAWINVRELRLAGNDQPLDVTWRVSGAANYANAFEVQLPLDDGTRTYTIEAYDFQGNLLDTASIDITSTVPNSVAASLRIVEINYNPSDPTAAELALDAGLNNDDFEFIQLENIGATTINLLNTRFNNGIDFTFPSLELASGQSGVIVRDRAAFEMRYGTGVNVLGEYDGGLANEGENITLVDGLSQTVLDFSYNDNDPWAEPADGAGATLELINSATTAADQFGKYYNWRASTEFGGTPAGVGNGPLGVVINEVLTHTDPPATDSIELLNTTGSAIDISGWYLSDTDTDLLKFQIPGNTILGPGQYVVFDEDDFNASLGADPQDFALSSSRGDQVWLVDPNGNGGVTSFVDQVSFGAAALAESFGRTPNGTGRLSPMSSQTFGTANAAPRVGPLVISELNYNPGPPSAAAIAIDPNLTASDLEFIEIHNSGNNGTTLTEWRLRGGVDFDFLPDGFILDAGETLLLLPFNPNNASNAVRLEAFRTHYGMDTSVPVFGGYAGQLNNGIEEVRLQRPDDPPPEDPAVIPRLLEDEVLYDNLAPWPTSADGGGNSLTRVEVDGHGNSATTWKGAAPTPGSADFVPLDTVPPQVVDVVINDGEDRPDELTSLTITFDENVAATLGVEDLSLTNTTTGGQVDLTAASVDAASGRFDLSALTLSPGFYNVVLVSFGITDAAGNALDGNGDGVGGDFYIQSVLVALPGDANLDGTVNAGDLNVVALNWRADVIGWERGDFNRDGSVNAGDLNLLALNWRQTLVPAAATAAVNNQRVPRAPLAHAAPVAKTLAVSEVVYEEERRMHVFGTSNDIAGPADSGTGPQPGGFDEATLLIAHDIVNRRRSFHSLTSSPPRLWQSAVEHGELSRDTIDEFFAGLSRSYR